MKRNETINLELSANYNKKTKQIIAEIYANPAFEKQNALNNLRKSLEKSNKKLTD